MSYDLAVWEGERPASDDEALSVHEAMYDRYVCGASRQPTPLIRKYVESLLARWPDMTETEDEDGPWAAGPLIGDAVGPYMYFAMTWSRAEEASAYAAKVAAEMGLICFDPQLGQLRP